MLRRCERALVPVAAPTLAPAQASEGCAQPMRALEQLRRGASRRERARARAAAPLVIVGLWALLVPLAGGSRRRGGRGRWRWAGCRWLWRRRSA
jgi:hypothetical protein